MPILNITDIDTESLELIFALATHDAHDTTRHKHISTIPQVCSRFNTVYTKSLLLWKDIALDFEKILQHPTANQHTADAIFAWLHRRRHALQHLTLTNCHLIEPTLDAHLYRLSIISHKLQSLRLEGCASNRGSTLSFIQAPSLQSITVTCHQPRQGKAKNLSIEPRCFHSLSSLPHLQSLELSFDVLNGDPKDLALVARMPSLTKLRLSSRSESTLILPEVLCSFGNITHLELENVRVPQVTPPILRALSSLQYLKLSSVLAACPRRKAGLPLWHALRHLPNLKELVIKDAAANAGLPAVALQCGSLEKLTIIGSKNLNTWQIDDSNNNTATTFTTTTNNNTNGASTSYSNSSTSTTTEQRKPNHQKSLKSFHLQDCTLDFSEVPTALPLLNNLTSFAWSNIRESTPTDILVNQLVPRRHMSYPPFLWTLSNLETLRLEYSGITDLPADKAANFPSLGSLSLEGNSLGWDAWAAFVGVLLHKGCLKRLSLANTGLERLPEGAEAVLHGLQEVELGRTLIVWHAGKLAPLGKVSGLQRVNVGAAPVRLHSGCLSDVVVEGGEVLYGLLA